MSMSVQPKHGTHSTLDEHPQQPSLGAAVWTNDITCQQLLSCAQPLLLVALA